MPASLVRSVAVALTAASTLLAVHAQPVLSGTAPNTSRAVPAPATGAAIPAGPNTGTPATSGSLPLGTPAAPTVLAPAGGTAAAREAARRPPATSQNPLSRSRDTDQNPPAAVDRKGRAESRPAGDGAERSHTRINREESSAPGFPAGMRDCVARGDRAARAACASALYGPGL